MMLPRDRRYTGYFAAKTIFLAEKIETLVEVRASRDGRQHALSRLFPRPAGDYCRKQISTDKAVYLQLLAALAKSPTDVREIERLLLLEPSLCFGCFGLRIRLFMGFAIA